MSLFKDNPPNNPPKASLSLSEVRRLGKRKLLELVEPSIEALQRAIATGDKDDYISVKAACAILDRTGFGTHSTITVDDKLDYSKLSQEELQKRATKLKQYLDAKAIVSTESIEEEKRSNVTDFTPRSIH